MKAITVEKHWFVKLLNEFFHPFSSPDFFAIYSLKFILLIIYMLFRRYHESYSDFAATLHPPQVYEVIHILLYVWLQRICFIFEITSFALFSFLTWSFPWLYLICHCYDPVSPRGSLGFHLLQKSFNAQWNRECIVWLLVEYVWSVKAVQTIKGPELAVGFRGLTLKWQTLTMNLVFIWC